MTFGKDAPPLPMYEYRVLKHVPTMVRRRYDRDLDNRLSDATLGLPSEESESRGDDGAEASNHAAVSDVDDDAEDELHADFDNEQDSQSYTDDMGMFSEESKSESGGAEDENIVYVGLHAVEDSRSEGNGTKDVNIVSDYLVGSVQDKVDEDKDQGNSDDKQGFLSEDGKSIGDDGAEDSSPAAFIDLDNLVLNNEAEETQTYTEDFGCIDFGQSANDSKSENGGAKDADLASNKDANVEDEIEGDGHAKSDNEQDDSKSECKEAENVMDANVEDKIEEDGDVKSDSEQGLCSEDCKLEDNGATDEDTLENFVNSSVKNEVQDNEQGLSVVEDSKSIDNGTKDADIACDYVDDNVQDKVEDIDHEKSDNEQGICLEDCKDEDDGAINANALANHEDASVKNEVQDNELEDKKCLGDGTEDANIATHNVDDSVQDEVEDKGLDISDSKQVEDSKSEVDATKDADVASYHKDDSAKDEGLDIEHDNKQDDSSSQGEGVEHNDLSRYEDVSVEVQDKGVGSFTGEQDFSPKAFKKTLERDEIDLCCPNCKNYITHTMIYRKKEDSQQHQTTCYTFLTALFSCMDSMVVHWRTNYRSHFD